MPSRHVLIVDDQRDIRRLLRSALETLGLPIQITDVPSGEEAILVISRQPVDVMISDVRLPGISGLELIERARGRNPGLALVLITGMTDDDVRRQVELAQAAAFFYKPLEISEFLSKMKALLGEADSKAGAAGKQPEKRPPVVDRSARAAAVPPAASRAPQPPAEDRAPGGRPVITYKTYDTRPVGAVLSSPQAPVAPKTPAQLIEARTAMFKAELNAAFVVIMDGSGEYLARAGASPDETEEWEALQKAAADFHASALAARKAIVVVPGESLDFCLTAVTAEVLLIAAAAHGAWDTLPASALWAAAGDLRAAGVDEARLNRLDTAPETPHRASLGEAEDRFNVSHEATLRPNLDDLFDSPVRKTLDAADVDAFWDTAAEDHAARQPDGGLSYDQVQRLGLAPDED